jgi:hypothetical protein
MEPLKVWQLTPAAIQYYLLELPIAASPNVFVAAGQAWVPSTAEQ